LATSTSVAESDRDQWFEVVLVHEALLSNISSLVLYGLIWRTPQQDYLTARACSIDRAFMTDGG